MDEIAFLQLMQLADSAAPIGSAAHSYGLETLVDDGRVTVDNLDEFLAGYVEEAGTLEARFCTRAHALADAVGLSTAQWLDLQREIAAFKPARESRTASAALGKRFLRVSAGLTGDMRLTDAESSSKAMRIDVHYCAAFGLTAGVLGASPLDAVLAYLQQGVAGLVSAGQRLMPLGQTRAAAILWGIKPSIAVAARLAVLDPAAVPASFMPLMEISSMRHPGQPTRLFIS
ncbi:MAG: urease accessory protein UreF [Capsulimonadaceae bacterium]